MSELERQFDATSAEVAKYKRTLKDLRRSIFEIIVARQNVSDILPLYDTSPPPPFAPTVTPEIHAGSTDNLQIGTNGGPVWLSVEGIREAAKYTCMTIAVR